MGRTILNPATNYLALLLEQSLFVWIIALTTTLLPGVDSDSCQYKQKKYDPLKSNYKEVTSIKDCPWGCCDHHTTPCCNTPVSVIVGSLLGGVLLIVLIVISVCCCCICSKRNNSRGANSRGSNSRTTEVPNSSIFVIEGSGNVAGEYYDPPPSYDEVMRGHNNAAFKPDLGEILPPSYSNLEAGSSNNTQTTSQNTEVTSGIAVSESTTHSTRSVEVQSSNSETVLNGNASSSNQNSTSTNDRQSQTLAYLENRTPILHSRINKTTNSRSSSKDNRSTDSQPSVKYESEQNS